MHECKPLPGGDAHTDPHHLRVDGHLRRCGGACPQNLKISLEHDCLSTAARAKASCLLTHAYVSLFVSVSPCAQNGHPWFLDLNATRLMLRAFSAGPYAMMGNNMVGTRGHLPPRHPHWPEAAHRRLAGVDARRPGREPAGCGGGQISAPPGGGEGGGGGRWAAVSTARMRPRGQPSILDLIDIL